MSSESRPLTEAEASQRLGVSPATLRAWRKRNEGPTFRRFGKSIRYLSGDLDAYVAANEGGPVPRRTRSRVEGHVAASDDKPSALPTFVLIDDEDLEHLPTPEWLWDGVLVRGGTAVMFGESGIGKTFEALEIGLSVQTGQPSQGRATLQGAVVYVPGEGLAGMKARVGAWKCSRDFKGRAGIHFTKRTVNLLDEADVKAFCDSIAPLKPVLVIIDTLARAMVGGDEDGSKDMGVVIDTIVRMAAFLNATILLLHHPVKKKPFVERGFERLTRRCGHLALVEKEGRTTRPQMRETKGRRALRRHRLDLADHRPRRRPQLVRH